MSGRIQLNASKITNRHVTDMCRTTDDSACIECESVPLETQSAVSAVELPGIHFLSQSLQMIKKNVLILIYRLLELH